MTTKVVAHTCTSDNIILIQHYLLNVNNSFHSQFSNNIKISLSDKFLFTSIMKNTELEHIFYNIALTARSPPLQEV